ncbi:amino acid ABC transporter permease [Yersinia pseudotuberculosis]|uniref:Amino acid ABC transporter permease n=1 Tax=Yersinia pseudotuberculosis TaxID=633 RepID=A0A380QE41_YERPU|nr:amino acid ABC transporter permease [Yersinia pseudotuberculosis]
MTYQLNFAALWPYLPELLSGLLTTIELTVMATIGGIALGICGAAIRCGNTVILRRLWGGMWKLSVTPRLSCNYFSSFLVYRRWG